MIPDLLPPAVVQQMVEDFEAELARGENLVPLYKNVYGDEAVRQVAMEPTVDAQPDVAVENLLESKALFVDFVFNRDILEIVNGYLGMYATLNAFVAVHNPVNNAAPLGTFLWHCDDDYRLMLKVFLYLNDIYMDSAHFCYIRGSHRRKFPDWEAKGRWTDEEMAARIPRDRWVHLTGRAGTVIIADTTGFHKGVKPKWRHRNWITAVFTAETSSEVAMPAAFLERLSQDQRKALKGVRQGWN